MAGLPTVVERPFGRFERMLALRYLGAKREHGGLAFISIVSVIGITLGVWALVLTMSIMNGFRLELLSKIVGFEPHAYIDTQGLPQTAVDDLAKRLRSVRNVRTVEPMVVQTALSSAHGRQEGVEVRGVDPKDLRANKLVADGMATLRTRGRDIGSLSSFGDDGPLTQDIAVGSALADAMGLFVGDTIQLIQPNGARTVLGSSPRSRTYRVSAIFNVGNERYDRLTVFIPIEQAKLFFGVEEGTPTLGVRISDPDAVDEFKADLARASTFGAKSWKDINGSYVTALVVERNVMRLILFVVVIITALNIITGILMLVKNKARDIAILRTIGATRSGVVRVFLMTGSVLGAAGVATGLLVGILCVVFIAPIQHFLEHLLGFEIFPKDVYMLDSLPARLQWSEVAVVGVGALLVTVVMSIVPSMWAARLNPVEALRFE